MSNVGQKFGNMSHTLFYQHSTQPAVGGTLPPSLSHSQ